MYFFFFPHWLKYRLLEKRAPDWWVPLWGIVALRMVEPDRQAAVLLFVNEHFGIDLQPYFKVILFIQY